MKSIKVSDYFKLVKPTYVYLKIIPHSSIRNYCSSSLAKTIALAYKETQTKIKSEGKRLKGLIPKKIIIEQSQKFMYVIDIKKNDKDTDISFYFIVPIYFESIAREKISSIWSQATIQKVDNIESHSDDALKYQLQYKLQDALSLRTESKDNYPLNSILNVSEVMLDEDRVTIYNNFMPVSQYFWRKKYKDTMRMIKNKEPLEKDLWTAEYIKKSVLLGFLSTASSLLEALAEALGGKRKNEQLNILETAMGIINNKQDLTPSTKHKERAIILQTQLMVVSESKDNTRKYNNVHSVCQAYSSIKEDNELDYSEVPKRNKFNVEDFGMAGVKTNFMSTEECHNFIQLSGKELIDKYRIKHNNTTEIIVPKELQNGVKRLGTNIYKNIKTQCYLSMYKDYYNLAFLTVAPSRSGKSTFLENLAKDCIENGECAIVFDFIESCGFSEELKEVIPKTNVLEINLYDIDNLQGLGYNEACSSDVELSVFEKYESAKKQAVQLITLINSVNSVNSEFTPKMEKYLTASALVCFIQNKSIKDVFQVLKNHNVRKNTIDTVPKEQLENLEEYILDLQELDEWSKATKDSEPEIVGTKDSYITGIIDRLNKLKANSYMEFMLKKDTTNNFNLLEEIEKNQVILLKMPEKMFSTDEEKDIMATYWITKIWMTVQIRAWKIKDRYQRKTVNVFFDELHQVKNCEKFVGDKLDKTAKFGLKFIISTMYINQLRIREQLRNANTSYSFISGAEKTNFKELKEEFEHLGFKLEDMMNLEIHHALHYIKYEGGYSAFITHLPLPIKENKTV